MSGALIAGEPVLRTDRIQGNILPGFKSDYQEFRGLLFDGAPAARRLLQRLSPTLTSCEGVLDHRSDLATSQAPPAAWVNVALSASGLALLGFRGTFTDDAFNVGIERRSQNILGDPAGATATWQLGGPHAVHALVIVAASTADEAQTTADELCTSTGANIVYREAAATLLPDRGHEHFGFRDGISQPSVLGRRHDGSDQPLIDRIFTTPPEPGKPIEAEPGTPLLWPGEFVFGYPRQTDAPQTPGEIVHAGEQHTRLTDNGSFLVVRRLAQDVALFRRFTRDSAAQLDADGSWRGLSPELLAALIVGRWPSGALASSNATSDPGVASNDFDFLHDQAGLGCPLGSHIRQVNPRSGVTDFAPLQRRIIRRGIPYGPQLPAGIFDDDGKPRGLMFLSYQTSISGQFERLVTDWMNGADTPAGHGSGDDVLLGQRFPSAALLNPEPRTLVLHPPTGRAPIKLVVPPSFVTATGGAYLFSPAIDVVAELPHKNN